MLRFFFFPLFYVRSWLFFCIPCELIKSLSRRRARRSEREAKERRGDKTAREGGVESETWRQNERQRNDAETRRQDKSACCIRGISRRPFRCCAVLQWAVLRRSCQLCARPCLRLRLLLEVACNPELGGVWQAAQRTSARSQFHTVLPRMRRAPGRHLPQIQPQI